MNTSIKRFDPAAEFLIPEGCHITELSNSNDDPDVSIAQARVESGVMTELHWLENVWERYVILAGQGEVEVGSEPFSPVGPGDVVLIPPGPGRWIHPGHHWNWIVP